MLLHLMVRRLRLFPALLVVDRPVVARAGVTVMVVMHTACKRQRGAEDEGKSGDAHMVLLI